MPDQPSLPTVPGARLVKALQVAGFELTRVSGSHHRLKHEDGRSTTVPVHGNKDVPKGTLRAILRDCELTVAELRDLL